MTLVDIPAGLVQQLDQQRSPVETVLAEGLRLRVLAGAAGMDPDALLAVLEAAVSASGLTAAEMTALGAAGVDLVGAAGDPLGVGAVMQGLAAEQTLLAGSLSVEQAATALGVTAARVRQRIGRGEIVTIRRPDGHVLPGWQFVDGGLVPGLAVACAPGEGLHPLVLARFMTLPHVDLDLDGEPTAPRDWLRLGGDPAAVAGLLASVARA